MKKMLTNNLGLKLLSVIGAIMLWLIVMNIDDPYTYRDFSPIQVTMLNENVVTDQGKVYKIEDGSDVISIRVWGKKSVLRELDITDFTATADMQKNIKYNDLVGIEVTCSNKNIRSADINLSRENVVISVEDASSEQFNVVVKQNGKVADGYMIGTALPEQSLIQINGPASVIAKIKRVEVEIKTTGVNSDRTIHGKLNVLNIIERIRHRLLKREAIGGHFLLMDRIDWAIDPATNGQYFFGEMLASFELPPVQPDFPDFDNLAYKNTRWFTDRTEELSCLRSEISE